VDEALAARVRDVLADGGVNFAEKRMFGGLAFMIRGHMTVGLLGEELMARVGADQYDEALAQPHARVMDFTGKPLRGYVYVAAPATRRDDSLATWVRRCLAFNATLAAK
jgi:TfoX/Sxy family transcriptional regulator of competence genes